MYVVCFIAFYCKQENLEQNLNLEIKICKIVEI